MQRDSNAMFEMLPDEMLLQVFRGVGCEARAKSDPLAGVCRTWRRVRADPYACTCQVDDLISRVLLDRDRSALQHIARSHRDLISSDMLGELCLAVGDLGCPTGDVSVNCVPKGDQAAGSLLFLACKEGRANLMRKLLSQGSQPTARVVVEACRRLHEQEDEAPIQALLDGATNAEDAEGILIDSVVLDSEDSNDGTAATDAMTEILGSVVFSSTLKRERLTTAFIYLLRWEPRFRKARHNYLLALESAAATKDRMAARDLFEQCHMDAKWITRSHAVLLAQNNWNHLLKLALGHHPEMAREALEWAVISKAAECVAVAAAAHNFSAFDALAVLQLVGRVGDDNCCSMLIKCAPQVTQAVSADVILQLAWRKRWIKSLRRGLRVSAKADQPARFLARHADGLVLWALRNKQPKVAAYVLEDSRVAVTPDTARAVARYVRTYENEAASRALSELLKSRAGVFR